MFKIRLKELRKEMKINQEELADIIGKSRSSVANYETGDVVPDLDTLIVIADYFDCTLDYLVGRSDIYIKVKTEIDIAITTIMDINQFLRDVHYKLLDVSKEMQYQRFRKSSNLKEGKTC